MRAKVFLPQDPLPGQALDIIFRENFDLEANNGDDLEVFRPQEVLFHVISGLLDFAFDIAASRARDQRNAGQARG